MSFERFMLIVADYRLDITVPNEKYRFKDIFKNASFSCWALDELENYVLSHIHSEPVDSVSKFINKMLDYIYTYPKTDAIFSVAVDVARDIYDILLCCGEENLYE